MEKGNIQHQHTLAVTSHLREQGKQAVQWSSRFRGTGPLKDRELITGLGDTGLPPAPHHHISKSLFTGAPSTQHIMYSYQTFTRDTERGKKNRFEETEQASEPGSDVAGMLELSKIKNSWKKPEKKKLHSTYRGTNIKITSNPSETMQARRKWSEIFKVLRRKKKFTRVLYTEKLYFRSKGEIKIFSDRNWGKFLPLGIFLPSQRC